MTARTYWGKQLLRPAPQQTPPQAAGRAKRAIDYERRAKGYVFGGLQPHTGEVWTACYDARSTANFVDFLQQLDKRLAAQVGRVYAIMDNLNAHKAADVLLFALAHPRWEFVFQPTYAAYLNLIEAWWKTLRSLALAGRRFETWAEVVEAVQQATAYWNARKHPYIWGRRRRHRPRRQFGVAAMPTAA